MIHIVLATHNGEKHLAELLQSIARQTRDDWLLLRDDASTDATQAILRKAARRDQRLVLIDDAGERRGVAQNFGALMQQALGLGARYVLFADQDDVWLPTKLEASLSLLRRAEAEKPAGTPLLVHSDLQIVDRQLRVIHPSLAAYAGVYRATNDELATLLVYNYVTGCSAAINRPLLELAVPVPPAAFMHDWWAALCAAACGRIVYLPEPTALHRQHEGNVIGIRGRWQPFLPFSQHWKRRWSQAVANFTHSIQQAHALAERLETRRTGGGDASLELVNAYCRLFASDQPAWQRVRELRRLGVGPRDPLRQVLLAARVWRLPAPTAHGSARLAKSFGVPSDN